MFLFYAKEWTFVFILEDFDVLTITHLNGRHLSMWFSHYVIQEIQLLCLLHTISMHTCPSK